MKPKRIVDEDLIDYIKQNCPCIVCKKFPEEIDICAHHIKTVGSGGNDVIYNLMPLCKQHHTEIHLLGTSAMARIHCGVKKWLLLANWEHDPKKDRWRFYGGKDAADDKEAEAENNSPNSADNGEV